jgi:hypothetical protein
MILAQNSVFDNAALFNSIPRTSVGRLVGYLAKWFVTCLVVKAFG